MKLWNPALRLSLLLVACLMPLGPARAEDDGFAGHYYLSGVMETGSELLLRPDGTFEWYLSYGALDQFADGTWQRDGDEIVLTAARPARDKPLFGYLRTDPWSAEAEAARLRPAFEEKVAAVRAACPFLPGSDAGEPVVATAIDPLPGASPDPNAGQTAAQALAQAYAARSRVEDLARRVMALATIDPSTRAEAETAVSDWASAREGAESAAALAGLPAPDLRDPALPPACDLPQPAKADADAPQTRRGGIAVGVVDPASGRFARDVHVALRFADGREVELTTSGREGLDVIDGPLPGAVVGARLQADFAPGRDASLAFPPVMRGVLRFSIDAATLDAAPFATMALHIDGDALVPVVFGRGRYERAR